MNFFNQIFKDLIFFKVKTVESYTSYCAQVQSFIGNAQRYIILLVPFDKAYLQKARIGELPWISLQTRTLNEIYSIPEQNLNYKLLDSRYSDQKVKLQVKNRTIKSTEYYCTLPIELSLLHDPKKKSSYQHPDELEILRALNTFQCIIKLL